MGPCQTQHGHPRPLPPGHGPPLGWESTRNTSPIFLVRVVILAKL